MTNAFAVLGMEPRLVLTEEEVRAAFREAGKAAHPDAGGGEGEFAVLREAFAVVSSPSRRLSHFMELRGAALEKRGVIGPELMDLFSTVGAAQQSAESIIRKRDEAKSVLAKALLEVETQDCRDGIETALSAVDRAIQAACGDFSRLEVTPDEETSSRLARDLAFLEKWRASLRSCFSRLV